MDVLTPEALDADLRSRFRTRESPVTIAPGEVIQILHPENADDLISEQDFAIDDRLPYWADLWPASVVLSRFLRGLRGTGRTLLELGCGSGAVASAAAIAGFEVTATDYYADSPQFARVNAWRNAQVDITARCADWNTWPSDLRGFDLIVASDVLYEQRNAPLIARVMAQSLGPHGEGWIADPGRVGSAGFPDWCISHALNCETVAKVEVEAGAHVHTISLSRITR
ncbi:MAG: methyltransferase domain-containing protein [Gemmatimonadaceae bacterium]|nr:methyltransferase domain-containing protein [Gemmatimonadaceae bacterium]